MIEGVEVRPGVVLYNADCLPVLRRFEENKIDAIVTDPPAGISFMGMDWDHDKGGRDAWIAWMQERALEAFRVLKPGGHALVWALPKTSHWTAMAWENAGFEVRDRVSHIFGSGFPKSLDISKAIDKSAGAKREIVGKRTDRAAKPKNDIRGGRLVGAGGNIDLSDITAPATDEAKRWEGWGTQLKPAIEDWWLFQKPISESTIAANVLKWGVGALHIKACEVPAPGGIKVNVLEKWSGFGEMKKPEYQTVLKDARYPAHLVLDGSEEVESQFPQVSSGKPAGKKKAKNNIYGQYAGDQDVTGIGDSGSAARFFYCAKPTKEERNFGVNGPLRDPASITSFRPTKKTNPENWAYTESPYSRTTPRRNIHPTVKAKALMIWLIKLITPPGGVVLDLFMGSGSTGVACVSLGTPFIGIENDMTEGYIDIATARILAEQAPLFPGW